MKRAPRGWLVGVAATLVTAATACGGSGRAPTPTTLRIAVVDHVTLDPVRAGQPDEMLQVGLVYEPLVALDPQTLELRPGLAARWHANRRQTTFTFTLRRGSFDDGTPVTAADVKASLERAAAKSTASPVAGLLASVRGFAEVHDAGSTTGLAGITAADAHKVVIELSSPNADFPVLLAHPALGIAPRDRLDQLADHPTGSGAFRVDSSRAGGVTLRRVVRPGAVPDVGRVALIPFASLAAAQRAVQRGEADVAPVEAGSNASLPADLGVARSASLEVRGYGINLKSFLFADARFREAVFRALNTKQIVERVYGSAAEVATGVVPAGVPGSPDDACLDLCRADTAGAAQLTQQVFPDGNVPILPLDFPDTPDQRRMAEEAQGELAEVGIPVTLAPHPVDQYSAFLATGVQQLFTLPTTESPMPAPNVFLSPWFVSGAPQNAVGLASTQVDGTLLAAASEPSPTRRRDLYIEAQRGVLDQTDVLPVAQIEQRILTGRRVRHVRLTALGTIDVLTLRMAGRTS